MQRFLLRLAAIIISMGTMILVMIKGWGVEPQNWWWIIGVYIAGNVFAAVFAVASSEGEDGVG